MMMLQLSVSRQTGKYAAQNVLGQFTTQRIV